MTERKKKGLILILTGVLCIVAGGVLMIWTETPMIVPILLMAVDVVLTALGLAPLLKPEV